MIKYKLICKECKFSFDSWFSSSREYDKLKKKKFLNCHFCNSLNVEKTLMSPNISISNNNIKNNNYNLKYKEIKKKILEYQNFIKKNFEDVGEDFVYEVRSIHYKNKKNSRRIYGSATKEDLRELKEEGIETLTIPRIKNTTN